MKDLSSDVDIRRAISATVVSDNTPQVSQIIDLFGYRSLIFAIATGSIADGDAAFTVLVEASDDPAMAGVYSVPDAELIGIEATAGFQFDDDNETRKIGYKGSSRYVRLTITPVNNASAAYLCALAILGHPLNWPIQ